MKALLLALLTACGQPLCTAAQYDDENTACSGACPAGLTCSPIDPQSVSQGSTCHLACSEAK